VIADLTGIPDFFAQIKPFPRSNIRGHRWRGSQLSPLKRWVNVVFATHIVITIPVLALMLVLMVSNLPKPVITAWDALLYQRVEFMIARMGGNVRMMFAIIVRALFPPLQLVGVGLILNDVARSGDSDAGGAASVAAVGWGYARRDRDRALGAGDCLDDPAQCEERYAARGCGALLGPRVDSH
jgi:hypothetical protein